MIPRDLRTLPLVIAGLLAGCSPAGDGGSYFQKFPNPYTLVKPGAELKLHVPAPGGGTIVKSYVFDDEYYPGSTADSWRR